MKTNIGVEFPIVEPVFPNNRSLRNLECVLYGIPRLGLLSLGNQLPCYRLWGDDRHSVRRLICDTLLRVGGIERVVIPKVSVSNGIIRNAMDFRQIDSYSLRVCDAQPAGVPGVDGVVITEGQAVAIATGDCPTVVISAGSDLKRVFVIHGGKKTLLGDNPLALMPVRESPIMKAIDSLVMNGFEPKQIMVKTILGIKGESFIHPSNHPRYGLHNQQLIGSVLSFYGPCAVTANNGIDLYQIIKAQALMCGLLAGNVRHDGRNTAQDKDDDGYLWHSQHRQSREGGTGRNLVIIANHRLL